MPEAVPLEEKKSEESSDEDEKESDDKTVYPQPIEELVMDPDVREPTDEEIMRGLDQIPMPAGHKESGRIILPVSVEEFFNLFHAVDAPYTFERYFVYRGYKKIELTQPWAEIFSDPELKTSWGKPS